MPPLGGLAVALALGLALWWAWPGAPAGPETASAGAAAADAASAASDAAPGAAWALLDQASRQADEAEQEANKPWPLCGFGLVQLRADGNPDQPTPEEIRLKQWDQDALHGPLMQRLATSDRAVDRVTAALLRQDRNAAATIALESGDPGAYALALRQCQGQGEMETGPGCRGLSAAGWATLDPGNAMAWWVLADEALHRGDAGAAMKALDQAQAAPRALDTRSLMLGSLQAAEPEEASPLLIAAIGVESALAGSAFSTVPRCGEPAYRSGPLREACDLLVRQYLARGPSLLNRVILSHQARRARLPSAPPKSTIDAYQRAFRFSEHQRVDPSRPTSMDCQDLKRLLTWESRVATHGEAEAVRQAGGPAF